MQLQVTLYREGYIYFAMHETCTLSSYGGRFMVKNSLNCMVYGDISDAQFRNDFMDQRTYQSAIKTT